ncbi:Crescent membrane and immature virion formation protein, partial [Monkeypox virus]
IIVLD